MIPELNGVYVHCVREAHGTVVDTESLTNTQVDTDSGAPLADAENVADDLE